MSYAMVSQSPGVGVEWHHALQRELGDEPVDGHIATYAGTGPDGMCVISVWESKAHADRFAAEQLFPTLRRLGVGPDQLASRSVLEIDIEDSPTG